MFRKKNVPPDFSAHIRLKSHISLTELNSKLVFLNTRNEVFYSTEGSGIRFMHVLLSSKTIHAAVNTLLEEYEVSRIELEKDLGEFIDDLVQRGIIELIP